MAQAAELESQSRIWPARSGAAVGMRQQLVRPCAEGSAVSFSGETLRAPSLGDPTAVAGGAGLSHCFCVMGGEGRSLSARDGRLVLLIANNGFVFAGDV